MFVCMKVPTGPTFIGFLTTLVDVNFCFAGCYVSLLEVNVYIVHTSLSLFLKLPFR
jgi:hypothetical protein